MNAPPKLTIRPANADDMVELCDLLNEIIEIGGSTAYETPVTADEFEAIFRTVSGCVCLLVAQTVDGNLLGFQSVVRKEKLPDGWGDIATFAKANSGVRGVGKALFEQTRLYAMEAGLKALNATVRADNTSGLAYYSKIGFKDYDIVKNKPLTDGTLVDRKLKVYHLE